MWLVVDMRHTHDENRKQEQSKKSGERKLLRNSRAVLDVFRSVGRERANAVLDSGFSATQHVLVPSPTPVFSSALYNRPGNTPWRSSCS